MKPRALLYLLVFSAGFSSMSLELAAVRALSPFFGSSIFVWTNLIGVILAALSLGYFAGGRFADRWENPRPLGLVLFAGGVLTCASPWGVPALASWMIPGTLRLEEAFPVFWGGSLLVGLLLFGIPAFLLSFTTPVAIRFLRRGDEVGSAAGTVFALSTLGSLLGTFLTTYVLVPFCGTRATLALVGGICAFGGALLWAVGREGKSRGRGLLGLALLIPAGLGSLSHFVPWKPAEAGEVLLAEAETPYQYVRISRSENKTYLRVNEGLDSFQSLWVEDSPWTGAYYDEFLLAPLLAEKKTGEGLRVLILGLAGGTTARQYQIFFGSRFQTQIDGVEIDSGLLSAAGPHFGMDSKNQPGLHVISGVDGRIWLDQSGESYDVVILDAYAGQIQIPFHLCSEEFFESVRNRLKPGGVFAVNVGALGFSDPVLLAVANTASRALGTMIGIPVLDSRNVVLFGRREKALPSLQSIHEQMEMEELRPLLGYAAFPGIAKEFPFDENRPRLTDDRSSIEWLQILSLLQKGKP